MWNKVLHTARALKKPHLVQTYKFQASKVHILVENIMQRNSSGHPFDDVSRIKVCFQSPTPSIISSHMYQFLIHITTWTVDFLLIGHTKADIISE